MRRVQFLPDGLRTFIAPSALVAHWRAHTTRIPARYVCGTADHETDFTVNEVDTEDDGYVSKGIFQIADSEADSVHCHGADLLDVEESVIVFARLQEQRLDALTGAIAVPSLVYLNDAQRTAAAAQRRVDALAGDNPDVWAYLAVAHNQGLAAALKTIRAHGLDWAAYKARNGAIVKPGFNGPVICAYGDDVISGGKRWTADLDEDPAPTPEAVS